MMTRSALKVTLGVLLCVTAACADTAPDDSVAADPAPITSPDGLPYLSQPLVTEIYTADPSAHVFEDRIYVYTSHDIDGDTPSDGLGAQFEMRDYRVLSMDSINGAVTIHDNVLHVDDVPWADKQMWAPDAAYANGTYYLYFPAKDSEGVFYIGVATSNRPEGPFEAQPRPIEGSYSMDPAVFTDDDGQSYMYFGGIWGGQLQCWADGAYDQDCSGTDLEQDEQPALMPKVARLSDDMLQFAETPRDAVVLDEQGDPVLGGDHDRRFFEAAWLHKHDGRYYLSYSTGNTHYIVYAVGDSPYGPFTYGGRVLEPVQGWTNHHSIVQVGGDWHLFYHDTQLSDQTHLRNVKVAPLRHNPDGSIETVDPFIR